MLYDLSHKPQQQKQRSKIHHLETGLADQHSNDTPLYIGAARSTIQTGVRLFRFV